MVKADKEKSKKIKNENPKEETEEIVLKEETLGADEIAKEDPGETSEENEPSEKASKKAAASKLAEIEKRYLQEQVAGRLPRINSVIKWGAKGMRAAAIFGGVFFLYESVANAKEVSADEEADISNDEINTLVDEEEITD